MSKNKKLLFIIFSIFFITLTFALGVWQVKRNFYKKDLISKYQRNLKQESSFLQDEEAHQGNEFRIFKLKGKFKQNKYFGLGPRFKAKKPGYDLHLFFVSNSGKEYILSTGFIKSELYKSGQFSLPNEEVTLEAMLRLPSKRNIFMPDNDLKTNFWFYLDKGDLAEKFAYEFPGFYFDLITPQFAFPTSAYEKDHLKFYDEHRTYAITWFLLSFALIILTVIFHKKQS